MRHSNQERFRQQVQFLRRQFLQDGDLPFIDVLTEAAISQALATVTGWLDRIFSPLVTLWVFLSQVLSADHSCRAAVARLLAHRLSRGQRPCSAETGAYCQARQRLPESFFADVACSVGRRLDAQAERDWLWKGRRVYLFDGTTVTMPDTRENQKAYPQVYKGKWGGGLPVLGYDVDASSKKLVINEEEAVQVRAIFALYLQHCGLLPVLAELARLIDGGALRPVLGAVFLLAKARQAYHS